MFTLVPDKVNQSEVYDMIAEEQKDNVIIVPQDIDHRKFILSMCLDIGPTCYILSNEHYDLYTEMAYLSHTHFCKYNFYYDKDNVLFFDVVEGRFLCDNPSKRTDFK